MNNISLIGRLVTEVDLMSIAGGSEVASFILAVERNGEESEFAFLPTVHMDVQTYMRSRRSSLQSGGDSTAAVPDPVCSQVVPRSRRRTHRHPR